ncbi:MAG TPA: SH3 domain-containing protein [Opitutales bacterium]|nr:SH3 domain-containing protein [Opitutales bacterium]
MSFRNFFLAVCLGGLAVSLPAKEATWVGDPWDTITRERIMKLADEMIDVTWSPRKTIDNFRTPGPPVRRILFKEEETFRGVAYNMIHEADNLEGFLWKVNTTDGGLTEFGNDCSAFLSIAWRLPRRLNTVRFENEMMGPAILVRSLGGIGSGASVELFRGDAFNRSGDHNLLFDRYVASGIISAEQTPGPRNLGFPQAEMRRSWSWSSLQYYRPMRRNLIEGETDAPSTVFAADDWAQTTPANLNHRMGPGTSYPIIRGLPQNTLVRILPHQNNGVRLGTQRWWFAEIYPGGERGWLAGSYLRSAALSPPDASPMPTFELTTSVSGEGKVMRHPKQSSYVAGAQVDLRAVGAPGWEFEKWEGDYEGTANPAVFEIDGEKAIVAKFRRSFDAWKESTFTFAERRDVAVSAPTADPFGHGLPNLAAYTFGLDPEDPDLANLPRMEKDGEKMVFVFRRLAGLTDIVPIPEVSSDLSVWAALDLEEADWEVSADPADPSMEIVRVTVPEAAAAMFVRLQLGYDR